MSVKSIIKKLYNSNSPIIKCMLFCFLYLPFNNKFATGKNNKLRICTSYICKCRFKVYGENNSIIIGDKCRLTKCRFIIRGNNNSITINNSVTANNAEFFIEDSNNSICLGEKTSIAGKTHLACIEGTKINIGFDCMLSANIVFRTGDSHSILNSDGERINKSHDINIANHVWIGNSVTVLKGVTVCDNSVIGTGAIVTKPFADTNIVIAGNPAKMVKGDINWDRNRLPV